MVTSIQIEDDLRPISTSKHINTPTKTRVRVLTQFIQAKGLNCSQNEIFDFVGISKQRGYELLHKEDVRRHHNQLGPELRGRKPLITEEHWQEIEEFVLKHGFKGRASSYIEIIGYCYPELKQKHKLTLPTCQKPYLTPRSIQQ